MGMNASPLKNDIPSDILSVLDILSILDIFIRDYFLQ